MAGIIWMLVGLLQVARAAPYLAPNGGERLKRLPERRAQILHDNYATRVHDFVLVAGLVLNLLGLAFALVSTSVPGVIVAGAAVAALGAGIVLHRRARPVVLAAFRESGLQPARALETSRRGQQRQRQFGVAVLTGYVVAQTAGFAAEREDIAWLEALSAGAMIFSFLAVGALLWSTAWVYGDETPSR